MSENIFKNSFYNSDPMPTWSWEIYFDTPLAASGYLDDVCKAVQDVKIPGFKVETLDIYFAGFKKGYQAKPTMNGQLTIKFADDENLAVRKVLETLFSLNFNPDAGKITVKTDFEKSFTFNLIVKMLDPISGSIIGVCKYYDCFIQAISDLNLDYKGNDMIDISATIDYKYFKVVPWNSLS